MKNKIKTIALATIAASSIGLTGCGGADKNLWLADNTGNLGYVNVDTGEVTVVGAMGVTMTDIAFDPDGNLYGITFSDLYSIDKDTGVATLIGPHNNDSGAKNSLVFDADGVLYAAWDALYTIDTATGLSNLIGNGGTVYVSSGDLAFHKGELYLSSNDSGNGVDELVSLDVATGGATEIGELGESSTLYGLSSNKNSLYGVQGTTVFTIDTATAEKTEVVNYADNGLSVAWGSAFESEAK
ncbi:MAG: hypothetical protein MI867_20685 [Pseudomonadales bacterium]|nr:hypothetical protein [Pseudomonadales bacterium]